MDKSKNKSLTKPWNSKRSKFFKNRNNGIGSNNTKNMWYYEMQCLGYNYRLSDISSALGISQLKNLQDL